MEERKVTLSQGVVAVCSLHNALPPAREEAEPEHSDAEGADSIVAAAEIRNCSVAAAAADMPADASGEAWRFPAGYAEKNYFPYRGQDRSGLRPLHTQVAVPP